MTTADVPAAVGSAVGSAAGAAAVPAGEAAGVELRGLRRSFGGVRALDGLSLTIAPGELVALLGPSGCGKTTALRIVAGFEPADDGAVLIGGRDMSGVPAARRDIGMVFQSYSLFPNMTALDNVAFGLRMRKVAAAARRVRAAELLELTGLSGQARQYPHQLSGGQQQRVALARALAIEPRVLLLDEPLSALDAQVRLALRDEIRSLQQRLGITTIFVTHDQEEALSMADRVGVMRDGRLEQIAAPDELYAHPATTFVAEFVGLMNRVPGELTAMGQVQVLGITVPARQPGQAPPTAPTPTTSPTTTTSPTPITSPTPTTSMDPNTSSAPTTSLAPTTAPAPGSLAAGPVDVLVRPEALLVAAADDPVTGTAASARAAGAIGTVTGRSFLGPVTRLSIRLPAPLPADAVPPAAVSPAGEFTVQADLPSAAAAVLPPGTQVSVTVPPVPALVASRH